MFDVVPGFAGAARFCRIRTCRMVIAFIHTHSILEPSAKACSKRANSCTKELPEELPEELGRTRKRLGLQ